jgi:hypothetical protein
MYDNQYTVCQFFLLYFYPEKQRIFVKQLWYLVHCRDVSLKITDNWYIYCFINNCYSLIFI